MDKYFETFSNVPFFGVLASAFAIIVVANLWYSPFLFGRAWARLSDRRLGDVHPSEMKRSYVFAIITALITAYLLGVAATHAIAHPTALLGTVIILWLFVMLEQANGFIWDRQPFALFLLQAFRSLFCLAAGSAVYLFWS